MPHSTHGPAFSMHGPISFPCWKDELALAPWPESTKVAFAREILSFLKHCKERRRAATTEVAKDYLAWRERQGRGPAREALRWFYRAGRKAMAGVPSAPASASPTTQNVAAAMPSAVGRRSMEPPSAASDLGGELMGHADVRTTQIYLHVMKRPGLGVRSPLDGRADAPSHTRSGGGRDEAVR